MLSPTIDLEPTNRCNAWCNFCPRDQTPHQGLMSLEVFDQCMVRIDELSDLRVANGDSPIEQISLCGLGEPLLNKHLPEMISRIKSAGYKAHLSSNGALLNEARSEAVLDAGLDSAGLNVGEIGEDYDRVYQLPWERTLERVITFRRKAWKRAKVYVVLVNHHEDPARLEELRAFWKERNIGTRVYDELMNRGGALELDHMQFHTFPERARAEELLDALPQRPRCNIPTFGTFIGYDGQFYLCCSDWKKEAPLGSVFDASLADLVDRRTNFVVSRQTVCDTCSHDPANRLTMLLRQVAAGEAEESEVDQLVMRMGFQWDMAMNGTEKLVPGVIQDSLAAAEARRVDDPARKYIPVVAT